MKSIYSIENCCSPIIYNSYSNIPNVCENELETFIPKFTYENEDSCSSVYEDNRFLVKVESVVNKEKESQNKISDKNIYLEFQKIKEKISKNNYYKKNPNKTNDDNSPKILGNKIKRKVEEIRLNEKENKNDNIYKELEQNLQKQKGRKRKDEIDKGSHTKYSEDNIMRKIKSNFLNYCFNLLNKSLKNKNLHFIRLNGNISKNLKRDYNLFLLNSTIKDIFSNSKISGKFIKNKVFLSNINKNLIEQIFKDDKEKETFQILKLTYYELFRIFRRKILDIDSKLKAKIKNIHILNDNNFDGITNFFSEIEEQEKNKNEKKENILEYINKIAQLCIKYENWFLTKKGRNRNKK